MLGYILNFMQRFGEGEILQQSAGPYFEYGKGRIGQAFYQWDKNWVHRTRSLCEPRLTSVNSKTTQDEYLFDWLLGPLDWQRLKPLQIGNTIWSVCVTYHHGKNAGLSKCGTRYGGPIWESNNPVLTRLICEYAMDYPVEPFLVDLLLDTFPGLQHLASQY